MLLNVNDNFIALCCKNKILIIIVIKQRTYLNRLFGDLSSTVPAVI